MAITKFDDVYATIEEIDSFYTGDCQWSNLTTDEKEKYIIAASSLIDTALTFEGQKKSDSQAMQFLRDFNTSEKLFSEEEQTRILIMATAYQVERYLKNIPYGRSDFQTSKDRIVPVLAINNNSRQILNIYVYKGDVANARYL